MSGGMSVTNDPLIMNDSLDKQLYDSQNETEHEDTMCKGTNVSTSPVAKYASSSKVTSS